MIDGLLCLLLSVHEAEALDQTVSMLRRRDVSWRYDGGVFTRRRESADLNDEVLVLQGM